MSAAVVAGPIGAAAGAATAPPFSDEIRAGEFPEGIKTEGVMRSQADETTFNDTGIPASGWKQVLDWIREIAISIAVATRATAMFALAIGFGLLVALKFGEGDPWVAGAAAVGFLLLVVLPVRLWWTVGRSE